MGESRERTTWWCMGSRAGEAQCGVSKSASTAPVAVAGKPRATASKIPSFAPRKNPPGNPARSILPSCEVGGEISERVLLCCVAAHWCLASRRTAPAERAKELTLQSCHEAHNLNKDVMRA